MRTTATLAALLFSLHAWASGVAEKISVVDPYVRMPPPGSRIAAAYMRLQNAGDQEARLVSVIAPAARAAELHNHINDKGIMRMRRVSAIAVPARGEVALQPDGYHLMLIDLATPLKEGERVTLILGFNDGSRKEVDALVKRSLIGSSLQENDHAAHPAR